MNLTKQRQLTASYVGTGKIVAPLELSTRAASAGQAFSAAVLNKRSGSTLSLVSTLGGKYGVAGSTLSGTGLTAGTNVVEIIETLAGAANSPRTTSFTIIVT